MGESSASFDEHASLLPCFTGLTASPSPPLPPLDSAWT